MAAAGACLQAVSRDVIWYHNFNGVKEFYDTKCGPVALNCRNQNEKVYA
jgi:hypothetical protein